MKPWWMQRWAADGNVADLTGGDDSELLMPADVARIFAATPALARELAMLEWSRRFNTGYGTSRELDGHSCPSCWQEQPTHAPACRLDAALTAAGLTPEDREAVRKAAR